VKVESFGLIVIAVVFVTLPQTAVRVTAVCAVTLVAFMVKVAVFAPAATVALAGTVAAALELESVISVPPVGATADNVTTPEEVPPLVILVGAAVTLINCATCTVNVVVFVMPEYLAVIVEVAFAVTPVVTTVNVAVLSPSATTTWPGSATPPVAERSTATPSVPAAADSVTVPVTVSPTVTRLAFSERLDRTGPAAPACVTKQSVNKSMKLIA